MRAAIASLLALASAVSAVGNAVVINNSLDTLYLWSVGDTTSSEFTLAAAGATWFEAFHAGTVNPGVGIKITKVEGGLFTGAPTQILGYTLDTSRVWFSLDAVNGEPFAGQKLTVTSNGGTGSIEWPTGNDIGDQTRDNSNDQDVVLTIFQST
ncbi:hypothetical protein K491DRAFT_595046 [Lophiostoma macrostomum CBS 122681]|uniref:BYS1 domain protein n=1 Tax=Lophiostoma macrostomum CBS 122681 TaxID=1314788 RepID=A0A6A6TBS1_9PLEO|nr:hypothetical protein K491DRAFT_595046 [Lophiostoma macrostomum CBS 122681]